jgi:hypothetical protein
MYNRMHINYSLPLKKLRAVEAETLSETAPSSDRRNIILIFIIVFYIILMEKILLDTMRRPSGSVGGKEVR